MKYYNSKNRTTTTGSVSGDSSTLNQSQQQTTQQQQHERSSLGLNYSYHQPSISESTRRIHPAQIRVVQEVFQAQQGRALLVPTTGSAGSLHNQLKKQPRKQQQQNQHHSHQRQLEQEDTTTTGSTNSSIPPPCQLPLTSSGVWTSSNNPLATSTTNNCVSDDANRSSRIPQPPQTYPLHVQQQAQQLKHARHRLQHRQSNHPYYHHYCSNQPTDSQHPNQRLIIDTNINSDDFEVIELIRLASISTLDRESTSEVNLRKMGLQSDNTALGDTAILPPPSLSSSSSPSMFDNILSSFSFGGNDGTTTNGPVPSSPSRADQYESDEEGQEALWVDHSANDDDDDKEGDDENRSFTSATMNSSSADGSPVGAKGPFGRKSKKGSSNSKQQQQQQAHPRGLSFFRNKLKLPSPDQQPNADDTNEREQQGKATNGSTTKFLSLSPKRAQKGRSSTKKDLSHQIVLLPAQNKKSTASSTTQSSEKPISIDPRKRSVTFQTPDSTITDAEHDPSTKEINDVTSSLLMSSSSTAPNESKLFKEATHSTVSSTSQSGDTSTTDYHDHPLVSSSAPTPTSSSSSKSTSPPSSPISTTSSTTVDKEKLKQAAEKAFTARRLLDRALSGDSASVSSSFFGGTNRKQWAQSAFTHAIEARQLIGYNTNNNSNQDVPNRKAALQKQWKEASTQGQAAVKKAQLQLQQQKNEKTTENEDHAGRARHYLDIILGDVDELVHKHLGILSKNGSGDEPTNAMSQDVSTLGFDNTFEVQSTATKNVETGGASSPGRRGTPKRETTTTKGSPKDGNNELDILSMSSLNEILDGPNESPDKVNKDTTPPPSPLKENNQVDDLPEATTEIANEAPESAKVSTANKMSKDKSKKNGRIFASVFRGKSGTSGKKDKSLVGAAAVAPVAAASTVPASGTRSASTSPSRIETKPKMQRFIASSIVEDDEEAPLPTVYDKMRMQDEDIASTIEERLQERLQAAFNNDTNDDGSLASLDGVRFHTREQMEREKELLEKKIYLGIRPSASRGIDEQQQQLPVRRRLIPQILPSFVAAPKGDPVILTQKSWESLTDKETIEDRMNRSVALKYDEDVNKDPEEESKPKIQELTSADDASFDSDTNDNIPSAMDRYAVASPPKEEKEPEVASQDKYSSLLADPCSFCDSFWISSTSEHKNKPLELSSSQDHSPSSTVATSLLSFASFSPTKPVEPTKVDDAATIQTEVDEDDDRFVNDRLPTSEPRRSISRLVKDLPIDDDEDADNEEGKENSTVPPKPTEDLVTDVCVPVDAVSLCNGPNEGAPIVEIGVDASMKPPVAKKMSLRQFFVKKNSTSMLNGGSTPKGLHTEADGEVPPFSLALGPPSPAMVPTDDSDKNHSGMEQENPTVETEKTEEKTKSTNKRGFIFASKKNVIKSTVGDVNDASQTSKLDSSGTLTSLNNTKNEQKPPTKKKPSFFMSGKKFSKSSNQNKDTIPSSGDSKITNPNDVSIDPVDTDESGSAASQEHDPVVPESNERLVKTTINVEEVSV